MVAFSRRKLLPSTRSLQHTDESKRMSRFESNTNLIDLFLNIRKNTWPAAVYHQRKEVSKLQFIQYKFLCIKQTIGHMGRMKSMSALSTFWIIIHLLNNCFHPFFSLIIVEIRKNFFLDLEAAACQSLANQCVWGAYRGLLRGFSLTSLQ